MPDRKNDVVVVGNIGIDTNVYFAGDQIDFSVEANFTTNIDMMGQAGGYASRGYTRLGYQTAFIGYVGADLSMEISSAKPWNRKRLTRLRFSLIRQAPAGVSICFTKTVSARIVMMAKAT